MKLDQVFGKQELPMNTIQRNQNQRPHLATKFLKRAGKKFVAGEGRVPSDVRPRFKEPIPPTHKRGRVQ
jgi:hypothetical protein